jgi:hypothetical protein
MVQTNPAVFKVAKVILRREDCAAGIRSEDEERPALFLLQQHHTSLIVTAFTDVVIAHF